MAKGRRLPDVSVVIPAYNRPAMLRRAVASALAQTHDDLEVLVVDDGSEDDLAAALADIADPRLCVMRHKVNRGASAARNTGIAHATAPFVAFLDSDDEWLPRMVERQLRRFRSAAAETVLVYAGVRQVPPRRPPRAQYPRGDLAQALLVRNLIGGTSCVMARRDALMAIGGFDESLPSAQDWDLYIRLARLGPVEAVDEPLVVYYRHAESITGSARSTVAGQRRLRHKHAAAIAALPPPLRARHEMTLAEMYLWKRAWIHAAGCLMRALWANPRVWARDIDRMLARKLGRGGSLLLPRHRGGS